MAELESLLLADDSDDDASPTEEAIGLPQISPAAAAPAAAAPEQQRAAPPIHAAGQQQGSAVAAPGSHGEPLLLTLLLRDHQIALRG
jgi:hypothetical protein